MIRKVGFAVACAIGVIVAWRLSRPADVGSVVNSRLDSGSVPTTGVMLADPASEEIATERLSAGESFENGTAEPIPAPAPVSPGARVEREYYVTGRLRHAVALDDEGKRHGLYEGWRENGLLWGSGRFEHGQKTGVWIDYNETGGIMNEGHYVHGRLEGTIRAWSSSGTLMMEKTIANDRANGPARFWHANGLLESQGEMTDGKRAGRWSFWTNTGAVDVERSGFYVEGKKTGD